MGSKEYIPLQVGLKKDVGKSTIKDTFPVTGMTCASCASSVESVLQKAEGIARADVNLATNTVTVEYSADISSTDLRKTVKSIGYDLIIDSHNVDQAQSEAEKSYYRTLKKETTLAALLALPIFIIGMFFMEWEPGKWISLILSIPVLFVFGSRFFTGAIKQIKHGRAGMDTLVAMSTGTAFIFSLTTTFFPEWWSLRGIEPHVYYEAATIIIVFVSLGKLMEEKAKSNTSTAIKKLLELTPNTVRIIRDGNSVSIPLAEVQKNDLISIKPGERIPVDGSVIDGSSFVDESSISGEPIPVEKAVGDQVLAGTLNQKGTFTFRAEKIGQQTLLSQIIELVKQAQGSKAPVQKLVDRVAAVFVPTVIVLSIITFAIWILFDNSNNSFSHALLTTISVLVVACPCALGLATPTAITVGIGKGAENGVLIKNAQALETANNINAIVFDKTGTLTKGRPSVQQTYWTLRGEVEQKKALSNLLALESASEHPLAEAIINYLVDLGIKASPIHSFRSITGKGALAKSVDEVLFAGNFQLIKDLGCNIPDSIELKAKEWQAKASTVVYFGMGTEVFGIISITDQIRESSKNAIKELSRLGIRPYILTGDSEGAAAHVAKEVGITDFRAEMLPVDKSEFIKRLQAQGDTVAMVGDGINDSAALAQADIGIAMGSGSGIALETADIALLSDGVEGVTRALKLSRQTVRGIRQNLFWAFVYNIIGIPIAAGILYPINGFLLDPMIAGGAMAFSSVSVVLNSLRLRKTTTK